MFNEVRKENIYFRWHKAQVQTAFYLGIILCSGFFELIVDILQNEVI